MNAKTYDPVAIVRALANGMDPINNEPLPAHHVCNSADVVRSLFAAAEALQRSEAKMQRKGDLPAKAGVPWTKDEDRKQELAEQHERTQTGIRARLVKYGRLAS